jgi:hypothetical protein
MPDSTPVRAADKKLASVYKLLGLARPYNSTAGVQAEQKAIQIKLHSSKPLKNTWQIGIKLIISIKKEVCQQLPIRSAQSFSATNPSDTR